MCSLLRKLPLPNVGFDPVKPGVTVRSWDREYGPKTPGLVTVPFSLFYGMPLDLVGMLMKTMARFFEAEACPSCKHARKAVVYSGPLTRPFWMHGSFCDLCAFFFEPYGNPMFS